jgi:hypothetical protein
MRTSVLVRLILLALFASRSSGAEPPVWHPVPHDDHDMQAPDANAWRSYRGAELSKVVDAPSDRRVLHVSAGSSDFGGVATQVTPRGGFGSRVRVALRYRVVHGGPVVVYAGPNTWNQVAAVLTGRDWETAVMEVGLLSDFHLVLHLVQDGPGGEFEIASLDVAVRSAGPGVRDALGPVDVAVRALVPSNPSAAFRLLGSRPPTLRCEPAGDAVCVTTHGPDQRAAQLLGALPAGSEIALVCRCRASEGDGAVVELGLRDETLASARIAGPHWADVALHAVLPCDGTPEWFFGGAGAAPTDVWISDPRVTVKLPDPLGPGVAKLAEGRLPIRFEMGDAKSIFIHPPWQEIPRIKCHLEYTSRWSFRFPSEHDVRLSDSGDRLELDWRFNADPVSYSVRMEADRPDSVLVEVVLTNGGRETVESFSPGFCLQIGGASAPKTFAYTIIPQGGAPFQLSAGQPFVARPELWPGIGWVRAHYRDSAAYRDRIERGQEYEPDPRRVRETGDFPLLARRVPGRDAWIAWIWPTAHGYFGNTQTPCMHMDPVLPDCPPGQTRRIFGRMVFFEGSWEELFEHATREREALARRSGLVAGVH